MNCFDRGKILITMKLTLFLLIGLNFGLHASGYGQRINLHVKNKPIDEVFDAISKQTHYRFLYADKEISANAEKVSITAKDEELAKVLEKLFEGQSLQYEIIAGTISVSAKAKAKTDRSVLVQQTLKGIVLDNNDEPLFGVSVAIKGTSKGTTTNENGSFSMEVKPGDVLVFSYVGFDTQEISYSNQTSLAVKMMAASTAMEEVVVVGFGTQKKVNLTGAVASVDMDALESRPVSQVGQALQGVVPGLNLNASGLGGELGQAMGANIRGAGTIGSGSSASPLVLIDGMEGNMNTLNPEDIASISVLKDASSSAIYGSRAAFGVILITTKSGRVGDMRVSYNNNFRYSGPTNLPKQLDSWRFANYFNEATANQGTSPIFNDETLDRILKYQNGEISTTTVTNGEMWNFHEQANDNVNWWKEHFGWSWSQNHNINLNGGSEKLQYYVSASQLNQDGNLNYGDDTYNRFTTTAKVNANINRYIDLNINAKFIRWKLDNPLYTDQGGLLYHDIARIWPMMPFKDPNGHYMRNGKLLQLTDGGRAITNNDNLYGQAELVIRPATNWNIYVQGGVRTINQNKQTSLNPIFEHNIHGDPIPTVFTGDYAAGASFAGSAYSSSNFYTTSVYSDYTIERDRHYFKGMLGMNTEEFVNRSLGARRNDLITPSVPEIGAATGKDVITDASLYDWSTAGFFGRMNYAFDDKYLLEANLRYDGSSRFLQDQRWTLLPSFSAGWNMAKEEFFEPLSSVVNVFKPRISWGTLGNQNTNDIYPFYLSQSVSANAGGWLMNGLRPTIAGVPGLISSYLTWERVYNSNFGLDMSLFNNRLTINYDYFVRITDDMVGPPAEVGGALGITLPNTNNAKLTNKGWELAATWNAMAGEVRYELGLNISDNRVKVLNYPNQSMSLSTYFNNMVLGDIWGYETEGVAATQQQMDDWLANNDQSILGSNWGPGDVMYRDVNGDGVVNSGSNTLDDHGDLKIIGNSNPRYRFGFNLGASWKNIDFNAFLQGVLKRDVWLGDPMFWGITNNVWQAVGLDEHLDYFRPADTESIFGSNVNAYYPRPYMGDKGNKNRMTQSRYLQDASYIRLKNIQFGYTLPNGWLKRINISKTRIFFSAENIATISKIAGMYDPEVTGGPYGAGKAYPLTSTFSFGINVTL